MEPIPSMALYSDNKNYISLKFCHMLILHWLRPFDFHLETTFQHYIKLFNLVRVVIIFETHIILSNLHVSEEF